MSPRTISIKDLHATTGEHVRRAGSSKTPVIITDRGEPVAALVSPLSLVPRKRKRTLLPEYEKMMSGKPSQTLQQDLDAIRGDR